MGGRGTGGQAQAAQVPGEPFAPAGVPAFTLPLLVLSASRVPRTRACDPSPWLVTL